MKLILRPRVGLLLMPEETSEMSPAAIQLLLALLNAALPGAILLVQDIIALFHKYPGMTPAQILAVVQALTKSADIQYDAVIAEILADQQAHPKVP
jgi:hypothetical protein